MSEEAVRFEGVTKRFGAATAVDDLLTHEPATQWLEKVMSEWYA